jgi:hypothetical protein
MFTPLIQERAIMFRRYTTLHILSSLAAFSIAAVWIVVSFVRHDTANRDCQRDFFPPDGITGQVDTSDQGPILCNIFSWVTAGLMAALWVVLAVMQVGAPSILTIWIVAQRRNTALSIRSGVIVRKRPAQRPREVQLALLGHRHSARYEPW